MVKSKKKVIVFGGSGFLGSHVADTLTKNNYEVTIIDEFESNWINKKQKFVKANLGDLKKYSKYIKKGDIVFNFAAISDIEKSNLEPEKTVKVNILDLVKLLNLLVKKKIKKFIYASTVYVSGNKGGFYKSSKLSAESFIKEFRNIKKLNYSILRYGTLYGPRSDKNNGLHSIIRDMLKNKKILYSGSMESVRNYIHVKDAARLSLKIIEKNFDNKTLVLTGPENYKITYILKILSEITGIKNIKFLKKNNLKKVSHYLKTPYNIEDEEKSFTYRYTDNYNVMIDQGLKDLILEIKEKYKF